MARPWKHPKTGTFWLRRAVPDDLRPLFGKREEKRTLGTRDPAEARIRHTAEMAKLDERWAALRRKHSDSPAPVPVLTQTVTLTERQAHERAAWLYGYWLDKYRDNPSEQTFWPTNLYDELRAEPLVQSFGRQAEKQPQAKTVYEWSREVAKFVAFLGHTDAARVTPEDVVLWKEALIAEERSAKTINDSKLVAVRTVLQWAVDSRRLPLNPAAGVRLDVKRMPKGRRGFTDVEAAVVLGAALAETNPVLRWVPWLCAYSGAWLSEVCQLRVEDVREVEGIWCLHIDAEAGSVKTAGSERTVPLNQAVLDSGFVDFVRGVAPLFADLSPDKFGKRGGNGTKMLGRWVRGLGLDEKRLAPAHSWRHWMKTLARRHGLADDVTRALMGHSGRTVADSYGEFEVATLYRELMKIPVLNLSV